MLTSKPRVLVLLAAFNGANWIREQIKSILDQVEVDVTLLISVDKSTDGTECIVDELVEKNPGIAACIHGSKFGGASKNFYRLISEADLSDADFVSFADQDDVWFPDKLSRACKILEAGGYDGYSSNVVAFWPNGKKQLINKAQPQRKWDYLFEAAGPGCTYVMKNQLASELQRLVCNKRQEVDDVSRHDWLCYAFARAAGRRWVIDGTPTMLYRQHDYNQVGANFGWRAFQSRYKTFIEGAWVRQSLLIAKLVGKDDAIFVERNMCQGRKGWFRLAMVASNCRRRVRDRFAFAGMCLILLVTK